MYGETFADVYDEWYSEFDDADATARFLAGLARRGPALELGVGTGRVAIPLAAHGVEVWGIDNSPAMLARLATKPGGDDVRGVEGNMAALDLGASVPSAFSLVYVVANTLFNLVEPGEQERCIERVSGRLTGGGVLVVDAFVPVIEDTPRTLILRSLGAEVVLIDSRHDRSAQVISGEHLSIGTSGVRRRPWRIRYCTPAALDELADGAGLHLEARYSGWEREPFDHTATRHVSVYRRSG